MYDSERTWTYLGPLPRQPQAQHKHKQQLLGHQVELTEKQRAEKARYEKRKYERENWEAFREEVRGTVYS